MNREKYFHSLMSFRQITVDRKMLEVPTTNGIFLKIMSLSSLHSLQLWVLGLQQLFADVIQQNYLLVLYQ